MKKNRRKATKKAKDPLKRNEFDRWSEEFLDYLSLERNCSKLTIRNYKHYLERFIGWMKENFPRKKLCDLNIEIIKKYRVYLSRLVDTKNVPLKRITQSYHIIALRSFLRFLAKQDVRSLAADKIELPKSKSQSLKFLSAEQMERLLAAPRISKVDGLRDKAILEVLFSTGLRVSELVGLNRDQINFKTKEFGVVGKGGRARVVFLSDRAVKWLRTYLKKRKDDWKPLFVRLGGKVDENNQGAKMRISERSVQRIVAKYVRRARLPVKVTPHGIRHSFATDLLSRGADIRSVQEMLGHKNIATTQIYTHVTNAQLRRIHAKFHSGNLEKEKGQDIETGV